MTKLYRIVSYVIGLGDNYTEEQLKNTIENNRYPEFHRVKEISVADIGEWSDDHPANKTKCDLSQFFPELKTDTPENIQVLKRHFQAARQELISERQKIGELEYEIEGLKEELKAYQRIQEFLKDLDRLRK